MKRFEVIWGSVALACVLVSTISGCLAAVDVVNTSAALMMMSLTMVWLVFGAVPLVVSARRTTNLDMFRRALLTEAERLSAEVPTEMPYRLTIGAGADDSELVLSTVEEKNFGYRILLRVLRESGVRVEH